MQRKMLISMRLNKLAIINIHGKGYKLITPQVKED